MSIANETKVPFYRRVDLRPRNFDLVLLVLTPVYLFLIYSTHLPLSVPLARMFLIKLFQLAGLAYALAGVTILAKALILRCTQGKEAFEDKSIWKELAAPYNTLTFLVLTFRRGFVILGSIFLFLHLKHLVLWLNTSNYDLQLWNLDRWLHFGTQPNVFAMNLIGPHDHIVVLLDWLYIKYFDYKLMVAMFFLLEIKGRKLSDSFFAAYAMLWLLGGLSYIVHPADGPCYAILSPWSISQSPKERAHVFAFPVIKDFDKDYVRNYVHMRAPMAKYYQETLWHDRKKFLEGKELPGVFYGVAAMPSLHVAAVTMLAFFLCRVSSIFGSIAIIYACITFISSVFLQWHYAVDGYIGFLLGSFCAIVAMKTPRLIRPKIQDVELPPIPIRAPVLQHAAQMQSGVGAALEERQSTSDKNTKGTSMSHAATQDSGPSDQSFSH